MTMPEDVQLSDDGQWWWDGQDWQPVETDVESGAPAFDFDNQGIHAEGSDGSIASADEDLRAGFTVINVGTAPGYANVVVRIDDRQVCEWDSPEKIWPGQYAYPNADGYVPGVSPQAAGPHKLSAQATPPGPNGYSSTNLDL